MERPGRALWKLLLAAFPMACGGGSGDAATPGRNVLLITIDAVSRDAAGFLGADPSSTPNLDRLSTEAVVFEDAYTVAPLTLPAHASLLTGRYPLSHGIRGAADGRLASDEGTLAKRLAERGWRCRAAVAASSLDASFGLDEGFESYDVPPRALDEIGPGVAERRAVVMVSRALADIEELAAGEEPFFYWLHLRDPHAPYDAPGTEGIGAPRRYAAEVKSADRAFAALFVGLRRMELWDELVVVVASSHGEDMVGGREPTHGVFLYDQTVRVLLLVRHPELEPGRVATPVSLVDVAPTLLALLGVPFDEDDFDGVDLTPVLRGETAPELVSTRVLAIECYEPYLAYGWAPFEGVVRGSLKYVRSRRPELYDRASDPREERNLWSADDPRAKELAAEVDRLFGEVEWHPGLAERADPHEKGDLIERMHALAAGPEDPDLLVEELRALLERDPGNPALHEELGVALLLADPLAVGEAEALLERAVELRPKRPRLRFALARCAQVRAETARRRYDEDVQAGRQEEGRAAREEWRRETQRAIDGLRGVLELDPDHPGALAGLASALKAEGDLSLRNGEEGEAGESYGDALEQLEHLLGVLPSDHPERAGVAHLRDGLTKRLERLQ
ncbi:MAG: sulfatase-like hydrolase/transferase [Planctomycetota bacterium]|nr:sulfatase-like hydrolase/transferase [Planctomycetota bacterium]